MTGTERQICAVCGRGILKGERTYDYATPSGEVRDVCALCRPSAERVGWMPPGRLESIAQSRQRRRHGWLSGLFARRPGTPAPARRQHDDAEHRVRSQAAKSPQQAPPPEPELPEPPPRDPVAEGVRDFNASSMPRLVAGLNRSLGEPQAEIRPTPEGDGALITVAWELSWYMWEARAGDVREVGKGAEVAERAGADPRWNATVAGDGRLTLAGQP